MNLNNSKLQTLVLLLALAAFIAVLRFLRDRKLGLLLAFAASILYNAGILYITLLRRNSMGISGFRFAFPPPFINALLKLNFGTVAIRSLLNLLMFVPLGYLIPYIVDHFSKERSYDKPDGKPPINLIFILIIGLGASLMIEIAQQCFRCGIFEIDDLVKNTLGAAAGWLLYYLINLHHFKKRNPTQ